MKKILSILLVLCPVVFVYSQTGQAGRSPFSLEAVYLESSLGIVPECFNLAVHVETHSRWGLVAGRRQFYFASPYKPADYEAPLVLAGESYDDRDRLRQVYLAASYTLQSASRNRRLILEAGPSVNRIERVTFSLSEEPGWFDSNYEIKRRWRKEAGFTMQARVLLPVSRYVGFTAGLIGSFNSYRTLMGCDAGLTIGLVRRTNRRVN